MLETIPVPAQSKFGAAVARRLNASRPIAPAGSLAMSGPTGTGFAPLPANLRDRRGVSATQPRQFDIRARVESRGNGNSKEYRLVVEFFHSTDEAVSLSQWSVPYISQNLPVHGWNELYTSEWSSILSESRDYYLNVCMGASLEEDGKWPRGWSANDTRWYISDQQVQSYHVTEGDMAIFRRGYFLAHVAADNSAASVTQKFDGPLMFLDFVELGRYGGCGGGGGDVVSSESGCFKLEGLTLRNCYWNEGGITKSMEDIDISSLLPVGGQGEEEPEGDGENPIVIATFICLETSSSGAEIVAIGDGDLEEAQRNSEVYVFPLYKFHGRTVVVDMRTAPQLQMWEGGLS